MFKTIETVILFVATVILLVIVSQQTPKLADALKSKLDVAASAR